jgi:P pilus assembly chaperone PapD
VAEIGTATAPAVSLSPWALEYSSLAVGSTSQAQPVLLRNMGSAALSVTSISVTGDFAETDNCTSGVPAASTCSLSVTFSPTAEGALTGSVVINDNAAGSPHIISLTGTGLGAVVAFAPATLTFPTTLVGVASAAQSVTVSNQGNATMNISNIQVSGDYAQSNNCSSTLSPSSSCTINVVFTPTAAGTRTGALTISDDAAASPQSVPLTGTGMAAVVSMTPTSLTFPATSVGASSSAQAVTLANQTNATVSIASVQVSGDFAQTNNCSGTLAASASCTFNVTFAPTAAGNRVGTLAVTDNASGSPQTVVLSGTGAVGAGVTLSPATLTFASTALKSSSGAQVVTLSNPSATAITITNVQITGDFSATNNCSGTLAAKSSCTLNVTFSPNATGSRTGQLSIADNAPQSPQNVALSGTGADFSLTSSDSSQTVEPGSSTTYSIAVTPVGGSFGNLITFSCSGTPANASCNLSPSSTTPGSTPANLTVTLGTKGNTTAGSMGIFPGGQAGAYKGLLACLGLIGLGLVMVTGKAGRSRRWQMLPVMGLLLLLGACAGGTGIAPQSNQTAPGTYSITVTATSGKLQHTLPLTLIVE